MVTQESAAIDANRIKQTLESLTGSKYVLKAREELIHQDHRSWYIHLPVGAAGYFRSVHESNGKVVFESPILYDVYQEMENRFSESKYVRLRKTLGDDVERLQDKSVREKYGKTIPMVFRFLDRMEEILSQVNQEHGTNVFFTNEGGWITLKLEVSKREIDRDESNIKRSILAMKKAVQLIEDFHQEQRAKSIHMGEIRRMHREILGTSKPQ